MSMVLYLKAVEAKQPEQYRAEINDVSRFMFSDVGADALVDFDVEWMAMNYVIEQAEGLKKLTRMILFGEGATALSEDLGYGPAYYVGPTHVAQFARKLHNVSQDQLREHFDPADMIENYVGFYFTGNTEEDWQSLSRRLALLRTFTEKCASRQQAIIGAVA